MTNLNFMPPDIHDAIRSLVPGVGYSIEENDLARLRWEEEYSGVNEDGVFVGSPDVAPEVPADRPTASDIEAELARLTDEWNSLEYARQRSLAYPSMGDQLDALFHAGVFPEDMAAQLQAVKDQYPKGG